jgi:hypothetical protein
MDEQGLATDFTSPGTVSTIGGPSEARVAANRPG